MSNDVSMCDRQPPINEIDRVVVALPSNATFYNEPRYLAVAFDASSDAVTPYILGGSDYLPYLPRYHVFSMLCGDRAIRTVDHQLLANGRPVTPEQYLGLWRATLTKPLSPAEFADRRGYVLLAVLGGVLEKLRGIRSSWTSSPFEVFDDFEAAYRDQMTYPENDGCFRLELDLRHENAARDAFYGEALLFNARHQKHRSVAMTMRRIDTSAAPDFGLPAAQGDLFAFSTEEA